MRLGRTAYGQVHPHLPARPCEQRPSHPVGERLRLRVTALHRPLVEQRQDAHVLAPCAGPMCWPHLLAPCARPLCSPHVLAACAPPTCSPRRLAPRAGPPPPLP